MKIVLLGANSYVGSRIYLELSKYHKVIGTFHHNNLSNRFVFLDVTDRQAVLDLIKKEQPEVIIHCANNASRNWCDLHPKEAVLLNQEATKYVVEGANSVGSKVIYISSFAAINHKDLYGEVKLASEQITKTVQAGYTIIRPAIVIGFSLKIKKEGGFFSSLMENIDEGKPAEYDATNQYQPTYVGHICEVIKIVLERNLWGKILPVATPDLKTKYELARDILSPFGISVKEIEVPQSISTKKQDVSELKELNLPVYTYKQVIEKVTEEIKNREDFVLQPTKSTSIFDSPILSKYISQEKIDSYTVDFERWLSKHNTRKYLGPKDHFAIKVPNETALNEAIEAIKPYCVDRVGKTPGLSVRKMHGRKIAVAFLKDPIYMGSDPITCIEIMQQKLEKEGTAIIGLDHLELIHSDHDSILDILKGSDADYFIDTTNPYKKILVAHINEKKEQIKFTDKTLAEIIPIQIEDEPERVEILLLGPIE